MTRSLRFIDRRPRSASGLRSPGERPTSASRWRAQPRARARLHASSSAGWPSLWRQTVLARLVGDHHDCDSERANSRRTSVGARSARSAPRLSLPSPLGRPVSKRPRLRARRLHPRIARAMPSQPIEDRLDCRGSPISMTSCRHLAGLGGCRPLYTGAVIDPRVVACARAVHLLIWTNLRVVLDTHGVRPTCTRRRRLNHDPCAALREPSYSGRFPLVASGRLHA